MEADEIEGRGRRGETREKERNRIRWQRARGDRLSALDEERTNEERKKDGVRGGKRRGYGRGGGRE